MTEKEFVMTLQSISLSQLVPSKANPRKLFDGAALEGLAASIRSDGLLQNLVVTPSKGKKKGFAIISGERRYRAMKLLEGRGELPEEFTVPVEVRSDLSKEGRLRLATVENLQRADLTPLEQTAALTKLVKGGVKLDEVAAQTGLSPATIKRRLALNGLCTDAKVALDEKEITLAQAEALTLGTQQDQIDFLDEIVRGAADLNPSYIRECLIDERPCVADAIFPLERYSGTITTDLFAEDEASYFDDADQFYTLQKQAVEELASHHRENAPWVEVTEGWRIPDWQYEDAPEGEQGGVLINLSPRGVVELREGLVRTDLDEDTAHAISENPLAPPKRKASYSAPLRRILAHHKSMAVQEVLLSAPRTAKDVASVRSFMALKPHECIGALSRADDPQGAYRVLETHARQFAGKLGYEIEDDEPVWSVFPPFRPDPVALYQAVKGFTDHELEEFQALLTALSFGQADCERLDTERSLFNTLAQDLNVAMRTHWSPDRAFFEKRSRDQLIAIAKECGYADGRSALGSYKKSELVGGLIRFFAEAKSAADPTPAQAKARAWLPEIMSFPALDPDAQGSQEPDVEVAEPCQPLDEDGFDAEDDESGHDPVREAA
ncbi:MAG: ParB/RepB/Spo0J family partition protein [Chromatiaceae bacterium]|nr:ParB/RepB/Spo0J family partition protein [Chromatiaceae bacterium]